MLFEPLIEGVEFYLRFVEFERKYPAVRVADLV